MRDVSGYSHDALFFAGDDELVAACTPFISQGIAADDMVLVHGDHHEVTLLCAAFDDDPRVSFSVGCGLLTSLTGGLCGYQFLCDREETRGRAVRACGPVPYDAVPDTDPARRRDWMRYEALLDRALTPYTFAGLCRYDTRTTPDELLSWALATHRRVVTADGVIAGADHGDTAAALRTLDIQELVDPLELRPPTVTVRSAAPAAGRTAVRQTLHDFGVDADVAEGFVAAVAEVVTNSAQHAKSAAEIRLHTDGRRWLCVVADQGPGIGDPYAGIDSPLGGNPAHRGAGLWIARQYCDRLTIDDGPEGATVRLVLEP